MRTWSNLKQEEEEEEEEEEERPLRRLQRLGRARIKTDLIMHRATEVCGSSEVRIEA